MSDAISPDLLAKVLAMPEAANKLRAMLHSDASLVIVRGTPFAFSDQPKDMPSTAAVLLMGELWVMLPQTQRVEFLARAVEVLRHARGVLPQISIPPQHIARAH